MIRPLEPFFGICLRVVIGGDYNNDGYMDLLAPSLCHPRFMNGNNNEYTNPTTIYMNTFGNHSSLKFIDTKGKHGIQYEETHAGASWGDINNDGLLDFFVSTYYGCRYNDIYIQKSDHSFELVSFETSLHEERGDQDGIWFDFNNDGNLDLLCNGKLYENKAKQNGNFIIISLQSSDGNKQGVGSKVMVYANGQRFYTRSNSRSWSKNAIILSITFWGWKCFTNRFATSYMG